LPVGEVKLYIKHFSELDGFEEPDDDGKRLFCAVYGLKEKNTEAKSITLDEIWSQLLEWNKNTPIFLKLHPPIPEEHLSIIIKNWSNEDFVNLIHNCLKNEGFKTDEKIEYVYRTDMLPFTFGKLDPKRVMKFNPHKIILTNTKTRKTTLGMMLGDVLDRSTRANFLGFSTADTMNYGMGDGKITPTYFDEVDSLDKILVDHIFNYMELGEARTGVGKAPIVTRGWSSLTFHANPKTFDNDPVTMMVAFNSFLQQFSEKVDGLGSRLALILFGIDFKVYEKTEFIPADEREKFETLKNMIIEMLVPKIEGIVTSKEAEKWLFNDLPQYKEEILSLLSKNPLLPDMIKRLWASQTDGYTHMRGFALKQAIFENAISILKDECNISKLLEDAEEHLSKLCEYNEESLKKMCEIKFTLEEQSMNYYKRLPEYGKALLLGCYAVLQENAEIKDKNLAITLEQMKEVYEKFYEELPENFKLTGYAYFSNVIHNIGDKKSKFLNNKLKSFFDIEIYKQDGIILIRPLSNWDKILSLKLSSPTDTDKSDKSDKTIKITEYENKVKELKKIEGNTVLKKILEEIIPKELLSKWIESGRIGNLGPFYVLKEFV
jgi:hypothetical protein